MRIQYQVVSWYQVCLFGTSDKGGATPRSGSVWSNFLRVSKKKKIKFHHGRLRVVPASHSKLGYTTVSPHQSLPILEKRESVYLVGIERANVCPALALNCSM